MKAKKLVIEISPRPIGIRLEVISKPIPPRHEEPPPQPRWRKRWQGLIRLLSPRQNERPVESLISPWENLSRHSSIR